MMLKILIGYGRAGKTIYAHKLEQEGYEYVGIDEHYHYSGEKEYFKFLDFLANKLNKNPNKNFILDGYINFDKHFDYLRDKLKYHEIKSILMFANHRIISERSLKIMRKMLTKEKIIEHYRMIINTWDFDEFVEGDSENRKVKTCEEAIKIVENE